MNGGVKGASNIDRLDQELKDATYDPEFHGDMLLGDPRQSITGYLYDLYEVFARKNLKQIGLITTKALTGQGLDVSKLRLCCILIWSRSLYAQ